MLRLRSPHLVTVEDLIVDGEHLAIVMELVPGASLRRLLEEHGPLPASVALLVVQQVLTGLSVVHAHGIVHRDVKPENVLLVGDPRAGAFQAKVTDFGIARLLTGPALTTEAALLGTPHYTAPELARDATPTPAVDVYAVGVLLYELLSGRTPFSGLPPAAVVQRQLEHEPPRPAHVPEGIWALLQRWLDRDPAQRPADARAALAELSTGVVLDADRDPRPFPVAPVQQGAAADAWTPGTHHLVGPPTHLHGTAATDHTPAAPRSDRRQEAPVSPAAIPAQRRRRSSGLSKLSVAALAAAVVLAGVGTGVVLTSGSSPDRQVSFPEETYPDSNVSVERTWVLKLGDHPVLQGTLTIHRGVKVAAIDEVLPKGLDGHISSDAELTSTDNAHILHYEVQPGPGEVEVVTYEVELAQQVATQAAVQAYAVEQIRATGTNYRSTHPLTRVELKPNDYTVAPGGSDQVKLRAWTGDALAPTIATYGASFTLADPGLAVIGPNGVFRASRSGSTRVTSVLQANGKRLASIGTITVLEAQVGKPDTTSSVSQDPDVGLAGLPAPAETDNGTDPVVRPSGGKSPSGRTSPAPGADPLPTGAGEPPQPAVSDPLTGDPGTLPGEPGTSPPATPSTDSPAPEVTPTAPEPTESATPEVVTPPTDTPLPVPPDLGPTPSEEVPPAPPVPEGPTDVPPGAPEVPGPTTGDLPTQDPAPAATAPADTAPVDTGPIDTTTGP